jgi:aerotolerance regulator-like protein
VFQILWQNPAALLALAAVAAPILIHILVQRRAEAFAFPTLRFLQPTRLAAMRRHLLEDAALLAVRAGILAAAVAALAGPLIVTSARRQAWEQRVVRAVATDAGADLGPPLDLGRPTLAREFTTASLPDGIRRAVAWLEASPPARRELVIASPFPIESITAADIAAIPAAIGIRFERSGTLPATREVDAGRVMATDGVFAREVTLDGVRTLVRETAAPDRAGWPIEIVNTPDAQPAIDAAVAAVLSQRVWAPAAGRRARVVISGSDRTSGPAIPAPDPAIRTPWIGESAASLMRDEELQAAAARVTGGFADARFATSPWLTLAVSTDGSPLAVAAESGGRLVVASAAPPVDLFTPLLLRSIGNALGAAPALTRAEVVPIADRWLRERERPAGPPAVPDAGALRREDAENDRRWLWLAALGLLALETWMRRSRGDAGEQREDEARVA